MNKYIIDVNILFSAFISGRDIFKNIFFSHTFYIPDFALIEIDKYKEVILKKTKITRTQLKAFTLILFSRLTIVPRFLLSHETIKKAYLLCKEIDEKDTMYVALSLELNVPLITRDKKLYNHLKESGFPKILLFDEFINNFI